MKYSEKKMSDICDYLDSKEFVDEQSISSNFVDYVRTHRLENESKSSWQTDDLYLKYGKSISCESFSFFKRKANLGSKQLSPSDYYTRTSLYNRPVAFEKTSRSWARSLLENFQKSNNDSCSSKSSSLDHLPYFFPLMKQSSSFDHHVQYIEHLNECNDYPAYLEYLRENRSQLFYTLSDSEDLIDGLIGTVISSF